MTQPIKEVVLPSGQFAALTRALTWGDAIATYNTNSFLMSASLAARLVTIDGKAPTAEQILAMPLCDAMPIHLMLVTQITDALKTKDGIA